MAQVEVTFKILGREIPLERVGDLYLKTTLTNAAREVKKKLESLSCPDHGEFPRVEISGLAAQRLNFNVQGCCDTIVSKAQQALR